MIVKPYIPFGRLEMLVKLPHEFIKGVEVTQKGEIMKSIFVKQVKKEHPKNWHFEVFMASDTTNYLMYVADNLTKWSPICQINIDSKEEQSTLLKWFRREWKYERMNIQEKEVK